MLRERSSYQLIFYRDIFFKFGDKGQISKAFGFTISFLIYRNIEKLSVETGILSLRGTGKKNT